MTRSDDPAMTRPQVAALSSGVVYFAASTALRAASFCPNR
jgi:hypothetical protein